MCVCLSAGENHSLKEQVKANAMEKCAMQLQLDDVKSRELSIEVGSNVPH